MTTIYDIDELQKENEELKAKLQKLRQVAQLLADCLHEDGGLSFPKRADCIYAKKVLEEIK